MKQGEKTRKFILDSADRLFYHQGFFHTSFSDIVTETGLSKGNITYHFKSKEDILKGIIDKRLAETEIVLKSWEEQEDDPRKRLELFCDMLVGEQNNLKNYGCPMGTLTGEFSKNSPSLYEITLPLFQTFRVWLSKQFEALGFETHIADEKAMSLLARVQGIAVVTHAFKDTDFLKREIGKLKIELPNVLK